MSRWFEREKPAPHLQTIQQALFQQKKLHLTWHDFRANVEQTLAPDKGGRVTLTLPFEPFESARARILSWGRAVEVVEPLSLRMGVLDFTQQIAAVYLDK